jgi:hypothetical protein
VSPPPKSTLANAADRGTRVHKFCEIHALGLFLSEVDQDCKPYVEAFQRWFDEMVTELVVAEQRINHPEYQISGKYDLLVKLKGDELPTIIDIKTPLTTSNTWALQTAAYKILTVDCLGTIVGRRAVLMLPRDNAEARFLEYTDHERDERLFLQALSLYRFFQTKK